MSTYEVVHLKCVKRLRLASGGNISSIMHLGLANMLMWQEIKEERDGYSNIGRYRNIINMVLLCVMHGNKWDHL